MSLLMEALKKAERAKQAAQEQGGEQAAADGGIELAPDEPAAPGEVAAPSPDETAAADTADAEATPAANPLLQNPRGGRPDFPKLELESIGDHEFELDPPPVRSRVPRPSSSSAPESEARERATARTVFDAKRGDAQAASSSRLPWLMAVLVLVLLAGGGGYWWIQKQFGSSNLITPQLIATGQLTQPASIRPGLPAANTAAAPAPVTAASAAPTAGPAPVAVIERPAVEALQEAAPVARATRPRPAAAARVAGSAGERRDASGASVRVSPSTTVVNATLDRAYRAYLASDIATAKTGYNTVLAADPDNRDALLGLAGIAAREKRMEDAEGLYLRILRIDPSDAFAQTGLIAIRGQADPTASESRLKNLIAGQPNAAYLHYALGNLYARAGRWNEAQQEHFRATTLDADNPDYCYNLAVSLDQIRQPQLAVTHYQRALALAATRPASFDASQLRARISELQK